jgi:hypothetical protein
LWGVLLAVDFEADPDADAIYRTVSAAYDEVERITAARNPDIDTPHGRAGTRYP